MADETTAWGQLLCTSETKPPLRLIKNNIRFGRTSDCDVSFLSNKYISGHHCTISRDDNRKTWVIDNSTNGTFLNERKLKKNIKVELSHKDKIQFVKRKNEPNEDVVFEYQDLRQLEHEEYNLLENTEEYGRTDSVTRTPELKDESDSSGTPEKDAEQTKPVIEHENKIENSPEEKPNDAIGETLICGICQDIFHDCLSLQPCMHSFCSACYSEWMNHSKDCPTCRNAVERMSRNHIINNLVEAYLKQHPEKQRDAEEIAEMDAKNKITEDMIRPNKKRKIEEVILFEDDEDDLSDDVNDDVTSDSTLESDDEEYDVDSFARFSRGFSAFQPTSFGSLFGFSSNDNRPAPSVCRWCPGFRENEASSSQATNSTANVVEVRPRVPQPVCPSNVVHLLCSCCQKPMPKQENLPPLPGGGPYAKSQKCGICSRFFCHLLWKCDKPSCLGCLNEFKDIKLYNNCLDGLLLNNKYESQILKNYLDDKDWTIQDLLTHCLSKLDSKSYVTTDVVIKPELNSRFILCTSCALKNLKELAFHFRKEIPRDELPAAVVSRPDCHWGKNCRTQNNPNNPHHARLDHAVSTMWRYSSKVCVYQHVAATITFVNRQNSHECYDSVEITTAVEDKNIPW